jgi:hypothetical protein
MTGRREPDRWHDASQRGLHVWTRDNVRALLKAYDDELKTRSYLARIHYAFRVWGRTLRRAYHRQLRRQRP